MKLYILFLLLFFLNSTLLNANQHINIKAICSDSIKKEFTIKINSNKLNLTEDAVQDNLGGYVDIPEDKYYLKADDKLYYLNGVVESNYENNTNQFVSSITKTSNKFINTQELYDLKNSKNLKLIQKIILDNNAKTTDLNYKTTTNILNVYFNEELFKTEYKRCDYIK